MTLPVSPPARQLSFPGGHELTADAPYCVSALPGGRQYRLLAVDPAGGECGELRDAVRRALGPELRSGLYTLSFASCGEEALSMLEYGPAVDLVVVDPLSGLPLVERLRVGGYDLCWVALSESRDLAAFRRAMALGAADFVPAPPEPEDLRSTLERALLTLWERRRESAESARTALLRRDIALASSIQRSVLTVPFPRVSGWSVSALTRPARDVAGDFYDLVPLSGGRYALTLADVSGKGVPAALQMMSARTLFRGVAASAQEPGEVLTEVNRLMCRDNPADMFVTGALLEFGQDDGLVRYGVAGHPPPLLARRGRPAVSLRSLGGAALGLIDGETFVESSVCLEPGDFLLLYSDGVTEAMAANGEEFGGVRLTGIFGGRFPVGSAEECAGMVVESVRDFCDGAAQQDDLTCAVLMRTG